MVFERVTSAPNSPMSHEVLYIGSAVPLETSEGLDAVQQPLRARYPIDNDESIQGVLSRLNITNEGIHLRFVDDSAHTILFPFSTLSMCAAVRCIKTTNASTGVTSSRFVSLSSPEAGGANSTRPAIFTAITRRTKGKQVLECHGFVTNTPRDALELVRWTSAMDRRSKEGTLTSGAAFGSFTSPRSGGGAASTIGHNFDSDASFRAADSSSVREFPIQMRSAEPVVSSAIAPGFRDEPSPEGYFYSTKSTQVKRYSLNHFHGSSGADDTPSVIGVGNDQFVRRPASVYAQSHASHSNHHHQRQQQQLQQQQHHHEVQQHAGPMYYPAPHPVGIRPPPPMFVPVRMAPRQPPMVRPVFVGGPPPPPPMIVYPRSGRIFSAPPPAMMRAQPVPVFLPPPGEFAATLPRSARISARRGSRGSSSDHSSSPEPNRVAVNGKKHSRKGAKNSVIEVHHHDDSRAESSGDEASSRPQTPPTDYEGAARGPRVSRREQFLMRERNGFHGGAGMFVNVMPPYPVYHPHHPGAFQRARSQPPRSSSRKSKKKEKKSKKSKSAKTKEAKSSSSKKKIEVVNGGGYYQIQQRNPVPVDEDFFNGGFHTGDTLTGSKANAENRVPRDFRRAENQFQHERAFSKSLAEEKRKSTAGDLSGTTNAYSLNLPNDDGAVGSPVENLPGDDRANGISSDPFPMY